MNIAEQVLTLKNDIDDVFKAGKRAGGSGNCEIDHTALYNEGYGKGYNEGETAGYTNGYAEGHYAEWVNFWDNYQDNGNRTDYMNAFVGAGWNDETLKPKYDIAPINANQMFRGITATIINVVLDFSNCTNVNNCFLFAYNLEEIKIKANTIKLSISFANCSNLSANSIQSIIDGLATVETTQTITFHASIVLTDEQKAQILSKGWTLVQ